MTPCALEKAANALMRFDRKHKRCKETQVGKDLLAKVEAKNEGKPINALGKLGLREGASLGEKIAFSLEMEELEKLGIVTKEGT